MSVNNLKIIIFIYLIMLGLNCLVPLYYGDDYVYAFIWNNQFMNIPLPEHVMRVNSISDILVSQWRHYFTGNGRTIAHLFVQFFVWQDKWLFNLLNPMLFVILGLQIHWISDAGRISLSKLRAGMLCWIFFALWTFVLGFWSVYLWVAGACNYLWCVVILLSFLMLYIRKYFQTEQVFFNTPKSRCLVFLLGVCAGWTNENTICWVILLMGIWFYRLQREKHLDKWMIYGYVGLCLGYILMIFAPGNTVKTNYYLTHYFSNNWWNIYSWEILKTRLLNFVLIEYWQTAIWFFILTYLRKIEKQSIKEEAAKYIRLIKTFCILSLLCNIIMLLTPDFPFRSGFPSLVFIIIASSLLIRVQNLIGKNFFNLRSKRVFTVIGSLLFVITLISTYWGHYLNYQYHENLITMISTHKKTNCHEVLVVPAFSKHSNLMNWISGQHLIEPALTGDENDWKNVAVARYYGIKGIRTINQ